eukprot:c29067_g3_i1 orf=284-448(+)
MPTTIARTCKLIIWLMQPNRDGGIMLGWLGLKLGFGWLFHHWIMGLAPLPPSGM